MISRSGLCGLRVGRTLPDHDWVLTRRAHRQAFDRLFDRGSQAVLAGSHYCDTPPVQDGRWGISVVLRPGPDWSPRLLAVTGEAMRVAGDHHWPTGAPAAVHFTVRALEAHRVVVPANDPAVARYRAALDLAAAASSPIGIRISGLTLTPSGIMACAYPIDDAADSFAAALRLALGKDCWFEEDFHRDIWYATLVHFAGPIARPEELVQWVSQRRDLELGTAGFTRADLIRFHHNGNQTVLAPLATACFAPGQTRR